MSNLQLLSTPFDFQAFKDFIAHTFPNAKNFKSHNLQPYEHGSSIKAYSLVCDNVALDDEHNLGVYVFQTRSTGAKVSLHKELSHIIANHNTSAILAAFYDESEQWRLSLVSSGYDFERNKLTYSNPRRQSFLLGKEARVKTAKNQLSSLYGQKSLSLETLQNCFSLEPVTKEFYEEYEKLYKNICAILQDSQAALNCLNGFEGLGGYRAIEAFSKKLLGRIIFLYFLQKKGWLGVERNAQWGEGDKNFLSSLFAKATNEGKNFYQSYLCPLFFSSLNTQQKDDYSTILECKIPFLNGGLFEQATNAKGEGIETSPILEELLTNELFAQIFDVFNSYNFTLEESTPNDTEISIDPEMLGKVFENLIDYNKSTGAFYTPREIVHYMCKNALYHALKSKLDSEISESSNKATDSQASAKHEATLEASSGVWGVPRGDKGSDFTRIAQAIRPHLHIQAPLSPLGETNKASGAKEAERAFNDNADSAKSTKETTPLYRLIFENHLDNSLLPHAKKIQEALLSLKVLDPAIGSGAFPMGLLNEILLLLHILQPTLTSAQRAKFKRDIIANQIYGVDIDSDAIEVAKLRFWLSIAVDEQTPQPLPNLDFKFMQGNSLLETLGGMEVMSHPKRELQSGEQGILFEKREVQNAHTTPILTHDETLTLQKHFLDYYQESCHQGKAATKKEILKLLKNAFEKKQGDIKQDIENLQANFPPANKAKEIAKHTQKIQGLKSFINELDSLYADYKKHNFHTDKLFLYRFFFAPVFSDSSLSESSGFDIIIGNPPYIRQEGIKELKASLQSEFDSFYNATADIYTYFFAKSLQLLNTNGILSLITSNKWCRASYGANLRTLLLHHTILGYIDFNGVKIFQNASVDTSIISISKAKSEPKHTIPYLIPKHTTMQGDISLIPQHSLSKEAFIFLNEIETSIKRKIQAKGVPLKEWDISIYRGILTGYNEAFIIDTQTKDTILESCISDDERSRTSKLIKPILRGRDIKRYSYEWAGLWLINTHNGYKDSQGNKIQPINIDEYPTLKAYFDKIGKNHKGKGKGLFDRDDKGITPYNLRNCAYLEEFEREKIVWNPVSGEYLFSYIKEELYFNNSLFMMTCNKLPSQEKSESNLSSLRGEAEAISESTQRVDCHATATAVSRNDNHTLLYALGLLNSNVYKWLITQMTNLVETGKYAYGAKDKIEKLPIPKLDSSLESEFVAIVREIIEIKKQESENTESKLKELESKLNNKVLSLFDFSKEELEYIYIYITISLLWIIALHSKRQELFTLLSQHFESEIKGALAFVPNLKMPHYEIGGKILYPCIMAKEPCFVYEEVGFFAPAPANIITGDEDIMKYLTGLLNSKAVYFCMRKFYMGGGIEGELKTNNLLKIPIPQLTESNRPMQDKIISLVEQILETKAKDSKADTKELESQIDEIVYNLYGLSDSEIRIIQGEDPKALANA